MKLIINGVSIDKEIVEEIVVNGSEVTAINETSKKEVCANEYTVDYPEIDCSLCRWANDYTEMDCSLCRGLK